MSDWQIPTAMYYSVAIGGAVAGAAALGYFCYHLGYEKCRQRVAEEFRRFCDKNDIQMLGCSAKGGGTSRYSTENVIERITNPGRFEER